jgi:putative Ca2+/H+ antiporter (TMEM165/GDT1 family)
MRACLAVFVSVFLAELGDKTQLATMLFATSPDLPKLGVFAASAAALVAASALAVVAGSIVGPWMAEQHLRVVAGVAFIAIGLWIALARG